jgi:putative transposase
MLVPPSAEALSNMMAESHRSYARKINVRDNLRGHLFQERFYSYAVQADAHFLAATRYIELNPVRAGMAASPTDYAWSSARHNVRGVGDPLVRLTSLTPMLADWGAFLQDGIAVDCLGRAIERHLRTGRPLGELTWLHEIERQTGRRLVPSKSGRPVRPLDF